MAQSFSGDEGTSFQPLLDSGASTPLPNPQDLTLVRRVSVPTQASLIAPLTFEIRVSAATTYQTPATEAHNASCRNLTRVQSSWSVLDNCSVILSKVCLCLCTYGCECVCTRVWSSEVSPRVDLRVFLGVVYLTFETVPLTEMWGSLS